MERIGSLQCVFLTNNHTQLPTPNDTPPAAPTGSASAFTKNSGPLRKEHKVQV